MNNRSLIALSPHPDDAAFSCSAILFTLNDVTIRLVTVFSDTNWTAASGFAPERRAQISAQRREEDRRFSVLLGCSLLDLKLPDSGVRGYSEHGRYSSPPNDPILPRLKTKLRRVLSQLDQDALLLLLPLAVGNHIDHLLARQAACEVFPDLHSLAFYEDLPYASRHTNSEIRALARHISPALECASLDIEAAWEHKLSAVRTYRSQLGVDTVTRITSYASRAGHGRRRAERLWMLPGAKMETLLTAVARYPVSNA